MKRICSHPGCNTPLNAYNKRDKCGAHDEYKFNNTRTMEEEMERTDKMFNSYSCRGDEPQNQTAGLNNRRKQVFEYDGKYYSRYELVQKFKCTYLRIDNWIEKGMPKDDLPKNGPKKKKYDQILYPLVDPMTGNKCMLTLQEIEKKTGINARTLKSRWNAGYRGGEFLFRGHLNSKQY